MESSEAMAIAGGVWLDWPEEPDVESMCVSPSPEFRAGRWPTKTEMLALPRIGEMVGYRPLPNHAHAEAVILDRVIAIRHYGLGENHEVRILLGKA